MRRLNNHALSAVTKRMSAKAILSDAEIGLLQAIPHSMRREAGQSLFANHGGSNAPHVLMDGWACYQRFSNDGKRQILDFLLPGDAINGLSFVPQPTIMTLALTPVALGNAGQIVSTVEKDPIGFPGLAHGIMMTGILDNIRLLNQLVRLGSLEGYARLGHLLLDFHQRLSEVDLVNDDSFAMPVRQEMLGDALGLSTVHLNRIVQQLRKDGYVARIRSGIKLMRLDKLRALCEWEPPNAMLQDPSKEVI
jgi:CRP-like cAMP-binding protein